VLAALICDKARSFGADLVGIAGVEDLKRSPSHQLSARLPEFAGIGTRDAGSGRRGSVTWPDGALSAIVLGVEHPAGKPELDWWENGGSGGNTPGNRLLMRIVADLAAWIEADLGIRCLPLPYHIERGGAYMKDAAVLAGLGHIGKNNMLVTPEFGPRVRLRMMLTAADLPSVGAMGPDPCQDCGAPCRTACPQEAFARRIYSEADYAQPELPGRTGVYDRLRCDQQMKADAATTAPFIRYCRECELACPAGSSGRPG
jgi:epoxyqueuosine reductase